MRFFLSLLLLASCSRNPCPGAIKPYLRGQTNLPVKLNISNIPSEYRDCISKAAEIWNRRFSETYFELTFDESTYNLQWFYQRQTLTPEQEANTTTYFFWYVTGAIVRFNNQDYVYSTRDVAVPDQVDCVSLALHELGHVIGLAHVTDQYSVMNPDLSSGVLRRVIQKPEMDTVLCMYGQ